jgi:hypothetical protein
VGVTVAAFLHPKMVGGIAIMKPLDYYAGYPNQQKTPKWVGVTLGSLFGGLTIFMLAVGIRMVMPARTAEASVAPKPSPTETPIVAPAPVAAVTPPVADEAAPSALAPASSHRHHGAHAMKGTKGKRASVMAAKAVEAPKYKKAQVFAKHVSGGKRDKKARDELDKMLGL